MRTLIMTVILAGALAAPAAAAPPSGPYATDAQAEVYLHQHHHGQVSCVNGHYSRHEKRTGRHFPGRKVVTAHGHVRYKFRSFACTVTDEQGTTALYVQTRPGAWVVMIDG